MHQEPDFATVAALIGEQSRATILSALLGGEALPASELAYRAQVTPQTASAHLAKLLEGDLIKVTTTGRHRYYSLKNHEVAQLLEALTLVAPLGQPRPSRITRISPELCRARTCYDHLAGRLGVAFTQALIEQKYLMSHEHDYVLTESGSNWFASQHIDIDGLQKKRRKFAYACLDWSERHFHVAGTLGAAIADLFFENKWIKRIPHTRALKVTASGEEMLKLDFGIHLNQSILQAQDSASD